MKPRESTLDKEGDYQAAKWLKIAVLADREEFASLFKKLGSFGLFLLGTPKQEGELRISEDSFLSAVEQWVSKLCSNESVSMADCRSVLASAMTRDPDSLWMQPLSENRYLIKIRRPVIQIQAHFFSVSPEDKRVHSMIFGKESIFWGVQFSFPQIFLDPTTKEIGKVDLSMPNGLLFQEIRRWARDETRATPFLIGGERVNVPIRLGKACFSWIARHPQLAAKSLGVVNAH